MTESHAAHRTAHSGPRPITLLVLDVDGVLTDGSITYDDEGRELKTFHSRDGFGVKLWIRSGGLVALLTGRGGGAVRRRAEELGVHEVVERAEDKGAAIRELMAKLGKERADTAYVGDDWPDLAAMREVRYPIAVRDAEMAVRHAARYMTLAPGGRGAVRDAVEHLLARQGMLESALGRPAHQP